MIIRQVKYDNQVAENLMYQMCWPAGALSPPMFSYQLLKDGLHVWSENQGSDMLSSSSEERGILHGSVARLDGNQIQRLARVESLTRLAQNTGW